MSNIRDLFSDRRRDHSDDDDDDDEDDDGNNRFVGGIGDRGGGSGLAVRPNPNLRQPGDDSSDAIFRLASQEASTSGGSGGEGGSSSQIRRTITMYRNGFVVDDGPYRRLDDPNNREFLQYLAKGQTPRELYEESNGGDVMVGLIDKRQEDYVEQFRSFSGTGQSLRDTSTTTASSDDDIIFDPDTLRRGSDATASYSASGTTTTPIQVRLPNGQRRVVRLTPTSTVGDLATQVIVGDSTSSVQGRFRLVAGFPPRPLSSTLTIEDAGLKGAQVSLQTL